MIASVSRAKDAPVRPVSMRVRASRAPVDAEFERSQPVTSESRASAGQPKNPLHISQDWLEQRDAPGKNRTCARGLGNRCSIH